MLKRKGVRRIKGRSTSQWLKSFWEMAESPRKMAPLLENLIKGKIPNGFYTLLFHPLFFFHIWHPSRSLGTGKQPRLSPLVSLHLTGCCYSGSSLMLADLSVFLSGVGPPATNIFLAPFSEAIERPDPTRLCLVP